MPTSLAGITSVKTDGPAVPVMF